MKARVSIEISIPVTLDVTVEVGLVECQYSDPADLADFDVDIEDVALHGFQNIHVRKVEESMTDDDYEALKALAANAWRKENGYE